MSLSTIIFLGIFAIGCSLALARHPIYGLSTYVATLYFDPRGQWWGQGALQEIRWELVAAAVTLTAMLMRSKRSAPSPVFRSAAFWGIVAYVVWLAIQSLWALDPISHRELLTTWIKFLIVSIIICSCVDCWKHFQLFLWLNVVGSLYLGWIAYTTYSGGRFQGFGTGTFGEANAGALALVIGVLTAASLFLGGSSRTRVVLLVPIAFITNGIVTTVSRSGFLSAIASLITFNFLSPKSFKLRVALLSAAAIALFLWLTPSSYWTRMKTIEYEGADVTGIDTGGGRLDIISAQWRMFEQHPFGCGAMCTTVLSPDFISAQFLSNGQRASHNTLMSMLVDHGIPGVALYIALLLWTYSTVRASSRALRGSSGFPAAVLPGLAATMVAITVADQFVQYTMFEARVWFVSLLIVHADLVARDRAQVRKDVADPSRALSKREVAPAFQTRASA